MSEYEDEEETETVYVSEANSWEFEALDFVGFGLNMIANVATSVGGAFTMAARECFAVAEYRRRSARERRFRAAQDEAFRQMIAAATAPNGED